MKKTLNLLLGLLLLAPAYAKSPVSTSTIAPSTVSIAPISPTGSIALQASTLQYAFVYVSTNEGLVSGSSDSLYGITVYFYQVTNDFQLIPTAPTANFTLDFTSGILNGVVLDWPAGQETAQYEQELASPPTGNYPATISPTTYDSYSVGQYVYSTAAF